MLGMMSQTRVVAAFTRKKMSLSKLQFLDDNFYLVTVTKKIVMVTENRKGNEN